MKILSNIQREHKVSKTQIAQRVYASNIILSIQWRRIAVYHTGIVGAVFQMRWTLVMYGSCQQMLVTPSLSAD